jgi:hypothetical protein
MILLYIRSKKIIYKVFTNNSTIYKQINKIELQGEGKEGGGFY